jgi:hypothetical protein
LDWEISFGQFLVKIAPKIEILDIFALRHIPLAELHQSSYCLCESIVSLKSYAMEYFGSETPCEEFFINYSLKKKIQLFDL